MTDRAAEFRAMYLPHCEDCARAGVRAPTPEEWVNLIEERLREASRDAQSAKDD